MGENCGFVKNMAITGLVSTNGSNLEILKPKQQICGMEELVNDTSSPLHEKDKAFLNGDWVGVCDDSLTFITKLRRLHHNKKLPYQIEIII